MAKPNDASDNHLHGEQRGYQPPQRPSTTADGKKVETGYVPPSRPLNNKKTKGSG